MRSAYGSSSSGGLRRCGQLAGSASARPAILERWPQDVVREFEPIAAATAYSFRGEIAHSILVVSGVLRGRDERGRRVLHVDVDDGVDDLVAPRLVETGMQPLAERIG
jgi:hypothetical protein